MILYPTIELQRGRCVSLSRGRIDEPMIWHVDPVETAHGFAVAGAEWMHMTDFDAIDGDDRNSGLIADIIRSAGIPVQLGGGFRTAARVDHWIDKGAGRIVIGSLATRDPQSVKDLAKRYPDQIVLSVDVWRGQVMVDGWRTACAFSPSAFIASFGDAPLAAVLIADIDSDVDDVDAQLGLVSGLAAQSRSAVIASGIVRCTDDIARLKYIPHVSGSLIGRALFRKTVDLAEALAVAKPEPEVVAGLR